MSDGQPDDSDSAPEGRARRGGARHNTGERVVFTLEGGRSVEGWMLNISRGGFRAIVEEPFSAGQEIEVVTGDALTGRAARVVWVKAQKDGSVIGVEFLDTASSPPEPDP